MTLKQYLDRPFKYDGNGEPWLIKEIWRELTRAQRREIQQKLKKGIIPDIISYL